MVVSKHTEVFFSYLNIRLMNFTFKRKWLIWQMVVRVDQRGKWSSILLLLHWTGAPSADHHVTRCWT